MRIGLYIEVAKSKNKSGIGRHITGLVNALADIDNENEYLLYYQAPVLGSIPAPSQINSTNFKLRPVRFPNQWISDHPSFWWKYYLPLILTLDGIDVFHGLNHFLPLAGKFKKVVTIHDLAYFYMEVHGKGMDNVLKQWTLMSFRVADAVIAVSEATRADCIKEGVSEDSAHTIYQGYEKASDYSISQEKRNEVVKKFNLPEKFLLFLGTLQPRKNLSYLIDAFSQTVKIIPHTLVLAGAKDKNYEKLMSQVTKLGIEDRVLFTGYISDVERVALYQCAEVFIYPSSYEGFGLVMLEAMSYEVPVITTNVSVMPEVVGDAAVLVELDNVQQFANMIIQLIQDKSFQSILIKKGLLRCEMYQWKKMAEQTLAVYKSVRVNPRK